MISKRNWQQIRNAHNCDEDDCEDDEAVGHALGRATITLVSCGTASLSEVHLAQVEAPLLVTTVDMLLGHGCTIGETSSSSPAT
jgi:hypothetical protein